MRRSGGRSALEVYCWSVALVMVGVYAVSECVEVHFTQAFPCFNGFFCLRAVF